MSAEADTDTYSDGEIDSVTVDDGEGDPVNEYDTTCNVPPSALLPRQAAD